MKTKNLNQYLQHPRFIDRLVIVLISVFSIWLMFWSFRYRDGEFYMIGRVWSDFGAHIPLIRSFSMGQNFPPEYPTFPGAPIKYHYLFYLAVGLLELIGVRLDIGLNLISSAGMILLLSSIYFLTKHLAKSRAAGMLAVILFLYNGTFAIWETIKASSNPMDFLSRVVTAQEWASFGPWDGKIVSAFWNWNIYLNQRHLPLAFGLALALMLPLILAVKNKHIHLQKWQIILILLSFLGFPLLHQAAYVMAVLWCFWWILWFGRKIRKPILQIYGVAFFLSLLTHVFFTQNMSQKILVEFGYLATDNTLQSIFTYWWFNLGLYSILIPIAWLFASRKLKVFFVPFVGFFVLANLFRLSPDMINNHKLINFFLMGGNILVASWLSRFLKNWKSALILPILIIPLTASGIADMFPILNNRFVTLSDVPKAEISQWIKDNTAPDAVFMSNHLFYNPASIVGRRLYFDYGYFNWSMGYKDEQRRAMQKKVFTTPLSDTEVCSLLSGTGVDWILLDEIDQDEHYDFSTGTLLTLFTPVKTFDQRGTQIYSVAQMCPDNQL